MKYFGKKSLSSWVSGFLHVSWFVVLVGSIAATVIGSVLLVLFTIGMALTSDTTKVPVWLEKNIDKQCVAQEDAKKLNSVKEDFRTRFQTFRDNMSGKDKKDFDTFARLPLFVKLLMFPYFWAVVALLLIIIKKSQVLFTNFKNDVVFNRSNVHLLSKISKLNIAFSILTFSFSSLIASIFLLMVCEIFRNGTLLQEEHDLTV